MALQSNPVSEDQPISIPDVYGIVIPETRPYTSEVAFKSEQPEIAIKETATIFDTYFNSWGRIGDLQAMLDFLRINTMNFLDDVQRGNFFDNFLRKPIRGRDLERVRERETGIVISPFMWEAYRRARIVFNVMPTEMVPSHLFAPPSDEYALTTRISEIQDEINKIIVGETPPQTSVRATLPLLRTFGFFKTAEALAA